MWHLRKPECSSSFRPRGLPGHDRRIDAAMNWPCLTVLGTGTSTEEDVLSVPETSPRTSTSFLRAIRNGRKPTAPQSLSRMAYLFSGWFLTRGEAKAAERNNHDESDWNGRILLERTLENGNWSWISANSSVCIYIVCNCDCGSGLSGYYRLEHGHLLDCYTSMHNGAYECDVNGQWLFIDCNPKWELRWAWITISVNIAYVGMFSR
jgi:hypothetical protein